MALFTGKGDDGTTYFFGSKERFAKDTPLAEALGTCDELGSLLGYLKARGRTSKRRTDLEDAEAIEGVQQNLFIIQAELAGADKRITEEKVRDMERVINNIEKKLPPIKTFFIPGANEISALYDLARTVARQAERRVVHLGAKHLSAHSLAYMNRLSSLLYAKARYHAQKGGKVEKKPHYR